MSGRAQPLIEWLAAAGALAFFTLFFQITFS